MTHLASRIGLFALILLSICGTACKKRSPGTEIPGVTVLPVPETKNENGWPRYDVPAEKFSLALPPGWRQFDMNPATFEKTFKEGLKENPDLEALLPNVRQQIAAGMKFLGVDEASRKTDFATNVTVLRLPMPPGGTLDLVVASNMKQFELLPMIVKPVAHERVKTGAGERERFRYKLTMRSPSGQPATLAITQFIFATATDHYTLTMTTTSAREAQYGPTFEKIGESFRIIQ